MFCSQKDESFLKQIIKELINLINNLYNLLREKEEQLRPKYRLIDWIMKEKRGEGFCRILIIGTSRVVDFKPQEIIANEQLILGFSPQDVCTITNLAHMENNKPKFKISSISFLEETIVTLKQKDGKQINLSINELGRNKTLISQLSIIDAFNLGKYIGNEDNNVRL
jgi:hypothetical protein